MCLPDHDGGFKFSDTEDVDADNFAIRMDGTSAESVSAVAKQAIGFLLSCGAN